MLFQRIPANNRDQYQLKVFEANGLALDGKNRAAAAKNAAPEILTAGPAERISGFDPNWT